LTKKNFFESDSFILFCSFGSENESDEEEIDDDKSHGNGMENGKHSKNNHIDDDDSDLDDLSDDEDEYDKTILESFNTCIDENDEVDEFLIFKNTLQSKLNGFFLLKI
jgi:hypothetical protein